MLRASERRLRAKHRVYASTGTNIMCTKNVTCVTYTAPWKERA